MDEEDDPLALIVASLEETAKIATAAHDAADATRQAAPGNQAAEHGASNTIPGLTCNIGVSNVTSCQTP